MDTLTHTLLATGCIAAAFYAGRYFTIHSLSEEMVTFVMKRLESGGYIKTTVDSDGEVELIPISEIIREDRIANSN
mgnify:FL=1|tara:strand:+ start:1171 stop:1398 length:228 start_codon:yes stop_codon:yes gene_type:complete